MDTALTADASYQFHHWYKTLQSTFMNIGLRLGYRHDEITDIIDQFFLDLLEKKIDPASIQNPQAYLSIAFRRKLIDHYRKYIKARPAVAKDTDERHFEVSIQDTIEQMEKNAELINAIRKAYKKLPARCRKVIDLKYYQNLATDEIALQTGLSKRSVYNNLFEGIKLLREELSHAVPGIHIATLLSGLAFAMLLGEI